MLAAKTAGRRTAAAPAAPCPEEGSPVASRSDSEIGAVRPGSSGRGIGTEAGGVFRRRGPVRYDCLAMAPYNGTLTWAGTQSGAGNPSGRRRAANPSAETASGAAQDPPAPGQPAQPTLRPHHRFRGRPPGRRPTQPAAPRLPAPTRRQAPKPAEPAKLSPSHRKLRRPQSGGAAAPAPAPAQGQRRLLARARSRRPPSRSTLHLRRWLRQSRADGS